MESGSDGCGDAKRLREQCGGPADLRHHAAHLLCHHPDQPAHNPGHHLQPAASQLTELLLPEPAGGRHVHRRGPSLHPLDGPEPPASALLLLWCTSFPNFLFLAFLFTWCWCTTLALPEHRESASARSAVAAPAVSAAAAGRLDAARCCLRCWPAFGWNNKGNSRSERVLSNNQQHGAL